MTRNKKPKRLKEFTVHLSASTATELQLLINEMAAKRKLKVIEGDGSHFQTIEIRSTHRSIRKFQKTIPRNILVSYEEKKPRH